MASLILTNVIRFNFCRGTPSKQGNQSFMFYFQESVHWNASLTEQITCHILKHPTLKYITFRLDKVSDDYQYLKFKI